MHKKFYESGIKEFQYNTCLNRKYIHMYMYIHIDDAVAICYVKGARSRLRARALFRILAAYTIIILDNHGVEIKLQRAAIQ